MTANRLIADFEGQHFPTLEDACTATEKSARHLVSDALRNGDDRVVLEFHIEDERGVRLANVPVEAKITGGRCTGD